MGMTTNRDIPFAKSLVDYIFRWMGMEFISGYREANAPQRSGSASASKSQTEPAKVIKEEKSWSGPDINDRITGAAGSAQPSGSGIASGGGGDSERIEGISASSRIREIGVGAEANRTQVVVESHTHIERDVRVVSESSASGAAVAINPLDAANAVLMGDAPACGTCGSITVRNGTCYRCMNCGNSMGCS
jgi:ribonucleoside-diphosphate reductase alpha chain